MKLDKGQYWDQSLSPVIGCTPCSPGCDRCWARRIVERFFKSHRETGFGRIQLKRSVMVQCKRKKPTVYALSWLGDLFHRDVPFEFVMDVFHEIKSRPQHVFLILTKRIERMKEFVDYWYRQGEGDLPKNAWFGATVCDNGETWKLDILRCIPVARRWISFEPLLEDLGGIRLDGLDWIVVGSESGSSARKASRDWIRSIVAQCDSAGVPCFVKQIHDENGKLVKAPWGYPLELPPELCRGDSP